MKYVDITIKIYYYYYIFVTFVQVIYNYKPEINHVSGLNSIAAVLCLQFVLDVMLFHT
jgi:hypothetical protein